MHVHAGWMIGHCMARPFERTADSTNDLFRLSSGDAHCITPSFSILPCAWAWCALGMVCSCVRVRVGVNLPLLRRLALEALLAMATM